MSTLAALEQELAARQDDLKTCNEMLALDPEEADALETIPILEADIVDIKARIAAAKKTAPQGPPPPPSLSDDVPPPPPTDDVTTFEVGNAVMARFSEDRQWYPATVVSKTGSSHDPVYSVTFKGYGNTETKRKHQIRAVEGKVESKKRKADGSPATAITPTTSETTAIPPPPPKPMQSGPVISAAPAVDSSLVSKREASKLQDGSSRAAPAPKKLKGGKTLEKSKNSWAAWQQSGPRKGVPVGAPKPLGKQSMFRTPDLPNARVGFVGSGKPMQKDQTRDRWDHSKNFRLEDGAIDDED